MPTHDSEQHYSDDDYRRLHRQCCDQAAEIERLRKIETAAHLAALHDYEPGAEDLTSTERMDFLRDTLGEGIPPADATAAPSRDEPPSVAKKALIEIAAGRFINENGNAQRLSREGAVDHARRACIALGWTFPTPAADHLSK